MPPARAPNPGSLLLLGLEIRPLLLVLRLGGGGLWKVEPQNDPLAAVVKNKTSDSRSSPDSAGPGSHEERLGA